MAAVTPAQVSKAATKALAPREADLPKAIETPTGASCPLERGYAAETAMLAPGIQVNLQRLSTRRIEKAGQRDMIDTPPAIQPKIPRS